MTIRRSGLLVTTAVALAACGGGGDEVASTTDAPDETLAPTTAPSTTAAPTTTVAPALTQAPPTDPATTVPPMTAVPTTTAAPTTTSPGSTALPDTPVFAVLEQAYSFDQGAVSADDLPAQVGEVTARWYRAGAVFAVVYDGLSPQAPACPGNSAQTQAGFDFVSNSPLPGVECDFPTLIESDENQGIQLCGDRVAYLTLIPSTYVSVLWSSVERQIGDGGVGVTGAVLVEDPSLAPEIDPATLSC